LGVEHTSPPLDESVVSVDVTEYLVIAEPPSKDGAVQLTAAEALPRVALTSVGDSGVVAGVTEDEDWDAGPVPTLLVAVTVNV
jgi:hypothetical protein